MTCPDCHRPVPDGVGRCQACGREVARASGGTPLPALADLKVRLRGIREKLQTVAVAAPAPDEPPARARIDGADAEIVEALDYHVTVIEGLRRGEQFDVGRIISFGRADHCECRLNDISVSREHRRVVYHPDKQVFLLQDLGSANGSTLNGRPVRKAELKSGDRIGVGTAEVLFHKGRLSFDLAEALGLLPEDLIQAAPGSDAPERDERAATEALGEPTPAEPDEEDATLTEPPADGGDVDEEATLTEPLDMAVDPEGGTDPMSAEDGRSPGVDPEGETDLMSAEEGRSIGVDPEGETDLMSAEEGRSIGVDPEGETDLLRLGESTGEADSSAVEEPGGGSEPTLAAADEEAVDAAPDDGFVDSDRSETEVEGSRRQRTVRAGGKVRVSDVSAVSTPPAAVDDFALEETLRAPRRDPTPEPVAPGLEETLRAPRREPTPPAEEPVAAEPAEVEPPAEAVPEEPPSPSPLPQASETPVEPRLLGRRARRQLPEEEATLSDQPAVFRTEVAWPTPTPAPVPDLMDRVPPPDPEEPPTRRPDGDVSELVDRPPASHPAVSEVVADLSAEHDAISDRDVVHLHLGALESTPAPELPVGGPEEIRQPSRDPVVRSMTRPSPYAGSDDQTDRFEFRRDLTSPDEETGRHRTLQPRDRSSLLLLAACVIGGALLGVAWWIWRMSSE